MPIVLNAFPLKIPELEIEARQVPYDKETLDGFRATHGSTHVFRRQGDNILIFSGDGTFPVSGTQQAIALKDNFGIFFALVKDGLTRHFAGLGRNPSGFNPIEFVSNKGAADAHWEQAVHLPLLVGIGRACGLGEARRFWAILGFENCQGVREILTVTSGIVGCCDSHDLTSGITKLRFIREKLGKLPAADSALFL